jgi:PAS domain S-box-containing protein
MGDCERFQASLAVFLLDRRPRWLHEDQMSSLATPRPLDGGSTPPPVHHDHVVQFYEDEGFLSGAVASFVAAGLSGSQPVVVIATEAHRQNFSGSLESIGFDVRRAEASGLLTFRDARETLATFMAGAMPDWDRFHEAVGGLIEKSLAKKPGARVRAYGEMVDLLWRDGNPQAAIRLEEFWNDLGRTHSFGLLCAYVMGNFYKESHAGEFQQICRTHTHVLPTESFPQDGNADARLAEVSRLQQRARALQHEIEQRTQLEKELRQALTERSRAEEALRQSQQELVDFFENAVEGLHWVGPDGTILWTNRAELDLLGYSKDEHIGHNIAEFHADRASIDDILARLGRNETLKDYEARLRCKNGSIKHVLIHSNVLFRGGKFIHTRCFTRDITDRKHLDDELRVQNEQLTRTVRFSEMFVGILGHDLRNPLSAIAASAGVLARRADCERISKPATRILSSAARMGRMIDQLLDFTRIRLGKGLPLERKTVDLQEVCRIAGDELDGETQGSTVQIETSGDLVGEWDGDRLTQLVSNLIGNALSHGSGQAPVVIRAAGSDARSVLLEVRNGGTIPAEFLPVIFEPFKSSTNRTQERSSGLGLGLYISQEIVLAHGGTIQVASSETDGTRFAVRLPRAPASGPEQRLGSRSCEGD